ncbi:MAG: right-handed parallel beta-helix repeat-containing protein [Bryobacteraceae bacterium]
MTRRCATGVLAAAIALLCACAGPEARIRRELARTNSDHSHVITLPAGVVEIAEELVIPLGAQDVEIVGGGGTILRMAPHFRGRAAIVASKAQRLKLRGFTIEGNRAANPQPLELAPPENAFRTIYRDNGILLDEVEGAEIFDVVVREVSNFAVLVSRSSKVRIDRVAVQDSGSLNAKGRNNGSGGMLLEEGTSDFSVTHCDFLRVRGNALWTHTLFTSPPNRRGVFAENHVDTVARDAFQVGGGIEIRVEKNHAEHIGYPPELVDNENQATPVGVDTAGDVGQSSYSGNEFREVNGKCFDLDGFHDGEVRGNVCRNAGEASAYPNGHFGVVFNNNDPRMRSSGVRVADNVFEGMKFGGVFLIGQRQVVEGNTFTRINTAHCNDRAEFGCLYLKAEPDLLRSGVYLSRGVKRMEETRGNVIRRNRLSGFGMRSHCVTAGPGVALKDNEIAGNACMDEK